MLINGQHLLEVSARDRGLAYGDGVFETVLVIRGKPVLWPEHLDRLTLACETLHLPFDRQIVETESLEVLARATPERAVLKIIITRGEGGRGYRPSASTSPTRIISLHDLPGNQADHARDGIPVSCCRHPVSVNPALAGIKHLNRLDQVMASLELAEDTVEGLMFDPSGNLVEATRSNVFLVRSGKLLTPDLSQAGISGIMRAWILLHCHQKGIPVSVTGISRADVCAADEVFVCNSVFGIWPVRQLHDGDQIFIWRPGPITEKLQKASQELFDLSLSDTAGVSV